MVKQVARKEEEISFCHLLTRDTGAVMNQRTGTVIHGLSYCRDAVPHAGCVPRKPLPACCSWFPLRQRIISYDNYRYCRPNDAVHTFSHTISFGKGSDADEALISGSLYNSTAGRSNGVCRSSACLHQTTETLCSTC